MNLTENVERIIEIIKIDVESSSGSKCWNKHKLHE
jgi:hypothetical protein